MPAVNCGADLVCIFVVGGFSRHTISDVNIFRIDIARYQILPAQPQRPVFTDIGSKPRINVKTRIVIAIAAAIPVATVVVIN